MFRRLLKKMLAIILSAYLAIFSASDVAMAYSSFHLRPHSFDAITTMYEVDDDSSPVRSFPSKDSSIISYFSEGEIFNGAEVLNQLNHPWVQIFDNEGNTFGFIYAGHVSKHQHAFFCLPVETESEAEVSACKCGYALIKSDSSSEPFEVDCTNAACELIAGNFSSTNSLTSEMMSDAISGFEFFSCASALTNPVSAGICLTLGIYSLVAGVRDFTADIYYCVNDQCDIVQTTTDTIGLIGGIASLHVNVYELSGVETNRVFKVIDDSKISDVADVANNVYHLDWEFSDSTVRSASCNYCQIHHASKSMIEGNSTIFPIITDYNAPSNLKEGDFFIIEGSIFSLTPITFVKVGVYSDSTGGKMETGGDSVPYTATFDLHALDSKVKFDTLSPGIYYYRVSASNSAGTILLINKVFSVS